MTSAGVAEVIKEIRNSGPPPELSAWQLNDFMRKDFTRVKLVLEVPKTDGSHFDWPVCALNRLVGHLSEADAA